MIVPWPHEKKVNATFFDKTISFHELQNFVSSDIKIVSLKQIHGSDVILVDEKNKNQILEGDALVTVLPNIALTVHTADCLPLLAFENQVVGACHGGWRGVSRGIIETWVAKMRMCGARIEKLQVAMGPAIGPCHFEVGKDVSMELTRYIPEKLLSRIRRVHTDPAKDYIDLKELARFKLLKAGLFSENIFIVSDCTYCSPERFYSYRRESTKKGFRLEALIVKPLC